jgi:hypothetical protein
MLTEFWLEKLMEGRIGRLDVDGEGMLKWILKNGMMGVDWIYLRQGEDK